jgi:hypothetical protein
LMTLYATVVAQTHFPVECHRYADSKASETEVFGKGCVERRERYVTDAKHDTVIVSHASAAAIARDCDTIARDCDTIPTKKKAMGSAWEAFMRRAFVGNSVRLLQICDGRLLHFLGVAECKGLERDIISEYVSFVRSS